MNPAESRKLVLASASPTRRALLQAAGLAFEVVSPAIDEAAIKRAARAQGATARDTALALARAKAGIPDVPDAVVIGCDQILLCGGTWFDKPANLAAARTQLQALRGRTHGLETACVAMRNGVEVFHHHATPRLTMRPFSDGFLGAYLRAEGDAVLGSVGAYRLEGPGIQLFESIEGDHSAILGLPLLPLLGFLRSCGIIAV